MKLKGGILITVKDIMLITGKCHERSAQREHQTIRDSLGKSGSRLTIQEYCDYWDLDYLEIAKFLNDNRK